MNERDERIEELAEHMVKTQGLDKDAARKIATEMFEYKPAGPSWFSKSLKKTVSVSPMIVGAMGVAIIGLSIALVATSFSRNGGVFSFEASTVPEDNVFSFATPSTPSFPSEGGVFSFEAPPFIEEGGAFSFETPEDVKEGRVYSFETPEGNVYSYETPPVLKFKIESNKLLPNSNTPPITIAPGTGVKPSPDEPPTITITPKTGTKAR